MSQLTDALSALSGVTIGQDAMKQLNAAVPAASRLGSSIEDYLSPRLPKEYQRVFWDANKDNPLGKSHDESHLSGLHRITSMDVAPSSIAFWTGAFSLTPPST